MQKRDFIFYEYKGFIGEDGQLTTNTCDLGMNADELACLQKISESIIPGKRVFEFSNGAIKANSLVGVITLGNAHIQILPKLISKNEKQAGILQNLMFMLSYTYSLEIQNTNLGLLGKDSGNFIETYIGIYANQLIQHLKRYGTPKSYVEIEENLNHIKGRIIFSRNSILNNINKSKSYCQYSEFTDDNPTSRAFKFVSSKLLELTKDANNTQTLRLCIGLLDNVTADFIEPDTLERTQYGKRDRNFLGLIQLTKMFLKKLRPEFGKKANNEVFALLFDMNELFEEFIYQVLRNNSKRFGIEVKAQKRQRLVTAERDLSTNGEWVKRQLFDTYTDIEVSFNNGNPPLVIDTKYKIIGNLSHYGIDNSDVYQILTYREIHKKKDCEPTVILLFPLYEMELHKEFLVSGSDATFSACTINLSRDLKSEIHDLVGELGCILKLS